MFQFFDFDACQSFGVKQKTTDQNVGIGGIEAAITETCRIPQKRQNKIRKVAQNNSPT